jgi:hypothetical protein
LRYFNSSPEVIRLVVLMCLRFPLSLRNVEDLLFERGIDICRETVRALVEPLRAVLSNYPEPGSFATVRGRGSRYRTKRRQNASGTSRE